MFVYLLIVSLVFFIVWRAISSNYNCEFMAPERYEKTIMSVDSHLFKIQNQIYLVNMTRTNLWRYHHKFDTVCWSILDGELFLNVKIG